MAIRYQLEQRDGLMWLHVTGDFDLVEACRQFNQVLVELAEHGAERVLVDCREVIGNPTTLDFYRLGEHLAGGLKQMAASGELRSLRVALLAQGQMLDPGRLTSLVATNRGAQVFSTDDVAEAQAWLAAE